MKYLNLNGFYKHLENASLGHLCRSYLIVVPDDYDRKKILKKMEGYFPMKPTVLKEVCFATILETFSSFSLFESEPFLSIDEIDKMGTKEVQLLQKWMQTPLSYGYFLAGAKGKTSLGLPFEKSGVVLDLSDEKPWDKDRRIVEELQKRAAISGKQITSSALSLLIERVGGNSAMLDSELDKLISYIGEKTRIEEQDVASTIAISKEEMLWSIAEDIVWEKKGLRNENFGFFALVSSIRSQLMIGKTMHSLMHANVPVSEWNKHLPKIWPKTLEKRSMQTSKLGASYFDKGLWLLYDLEHLSRYGQTNEEALLELFRSSL